MVKDPKARLGYKTGIKEIMGHPWLKEVNWDKILKKEISPPFQPRVNQSHFDIEYTSMRIDLDMFYGE